MQNKKLVDDWVNSAKMDYLTAIHLFENMYPKPLEIIGYHSQQAVEKLLKAMLTSFGHKLLKTHDLGLLAETLQEFMEISETELGRVGKPRQRALTAILPPELRQKTKYLATSRRQEFTNTP